MKVNGKDDIPYIYNYIYNYIYIYEMENKTYLKPPTSIGRSQYLEVQFQ